MGPQVRPVPDTPPRVLGMVRVSKERTGMMSPDVQRAAISSYCEARGYVIVDWLEGLDESGSRVKSAWWSRLDQAVEQVKAGEIDVIVVWKFSRTARHRLKWAIALDAVDTAGGRLESATEQVDATTSTGRFTRGMLAELNAFEAERIGEVWKEVQASRVAEGKAPNGLPRAGYVWNKARQVHEPDPVVGPALAAVYERYVAGESFVSLARWLTESRIPTTKGGMWTSSGLRRVTDAGFAAGLMRWKGGLVPGRHEPLISAELWQRYQDARAARHYVAPRARVSKYLLTGLLRCAQCGGSMAGSKGNGRGDAYRCTRHKMIGPMACTATSVQVAIVEGALMRWLEGVAGDVDAASRIAADASIRRLSAEAEVRRLSAELTRLDDAMTRLTIQVAEGLVPERAYAGAWEKLSADYAAAQTRLEGHARMARQIDVDHQAMARELVDDWDWLQLDVKRELLRALLGGIRTTTGGKVSRKGHRGGVSAAVVEIRPAWAEEWLVV